MSVAVAVPVVRRQSENRLIGILQFPFGLSFRSSCACGREDHFPASAAIHFAGWAQGRTGPRPHRLVDLLGQRRWGMLGPSGKPIQSVTETLPTRTVFAVL